MPGKLTQAHAKIESQCNKCHLQFDKSNQSPLCLDCHKAIKSDLQNSTGFHSKLAKNKIKQCSLCHTDHQGRNTNITSLDTEHFNHQQTEFPLKNSHLKLSCNDCHKKNNKNFRIKLKVGQCTSCHQDPHQGKLKNDCSKCHNQKKWQVRQFDHSKTTFKLVGKHQQLICQSCHVNDVSKKIGDQCVNCHRSKDKHFNVFGNKCGACHTSKSWKKTDYNHYSSTKFRLLGKHKTLACVDCHLKKVSPEKSCNSCHKNNDIHLGNNGTDCQQCHNNNKWQDTSFDHNNDTDFTLQGAHKKLNCDACHLLNSEKKAVATTRQCNDCHQLTDAHRGKLGKDCQDCHKQQQWNQQVTFNHDFTLFPLTGAHQLLFCQSCHDTADFSVKSFKCADCHIDDDFHQKTLGNKCEQCHNTSSWSAWQFDHQRQTDFPLKGAHNKLACNLCHKKELPKPLKPAKECVSCHKKDDTHHGTFGRNCQQCHNKESFYDFQH